MSDNMPMPMKWMMKMMMMKNMKNHDYESHVDQYDVMKERTNLPMEARMDKIESLLKYAFQNKMNKEQNTYNDMKNSNSNYKKQDMFRNLFDMRDSNMDYSNMFNHRQARAAGKNLDLGDRLVEKLQGQKQEMEEKVGNLTCILQEMNVLNAKNEISISTMKEDLEEYNLPSVWFKENHEALIDTCYEMATTLPAELEDGYIVEGEFGTVNMAQVKMFMNCCSREKMNLCINHETKLRIEKNHGSLEDNAKLVGLTEQQLLPVAVALAQSQEYKLEDFL